MATVTYTLSNTRNMNDRSLVGIAMGNVSGKIDFRGTALANCTINSVRLYIPAGSCRGSGTFTLNINGCSMNVNLGWISNDGTYAMEYWLQGANISAFSNASGTATFSVAMNDSKYFYISSYDMTLTIDYTVSASSFDFPDTVEIGSNGTTVTMTVYPNNTNYNHQGIVYFGNKMTNNDHINAASGFKWTFSLPNTWLEEIPTSNSGTATVKLHTYDETGTWLAVVTKTITVKCPTAAFSYYAPTDHTYWSAQYTVNDVKYPSTYPVLVAGKCGILAVAPEQPLHNCSAITEYLITLKPKDGSVIFSSSSRWLRTGLLPKAGTYVISYSCKDARGTWSQTYTKEFNVVAYTKPSITRLNIMRTNTAGATDNQGASACFDFTISVPSASDIGMTYTNGLNITAQLMKSDGVTAAYAAFSLDKNNLSQDNVFVKNNTEQVTNLSSMNSYVLVLKITDIYNTVSKTVILPSRNFIMHVRKDGKSIGIGQAAETDKNNIITVNQDWNLYVHGKEINDIVVGAARGNRNCLDNWDFRNPVNQRKRPDYAGIEYRIDRWRTWEIGNVVCASGGLQMNVSLYQYFPNDYLDGKTITMSIKFADGTIFSKSGTAIYERWFIYPVHYQGINSIGYMEETKGMPYFRIESDGTTSGTIESVKVEPGNVSTLANDSPMDYRTELLKCQQYYYCSTSDFATSTNYYNGYTASVNAAIAAGGTFTTTTPLEYPVEMRVIPTITFYGNNTRNALRNASTGATVTFSSCDYFAGKKRCVPRFKGLSSAINANSMVSAQFELSADM